LQDLSTYSDQQLLQMLGAGDHSAFEALYRRYSPMMYKAAFAVLNDRQASSDLVQEIFIWLWEKRLSLSIATIQPYLRTAVKFKVANLIRSGKIRDSFFEEMARRNIGSENNAEEQMEVKHMKMVIQQAIDALPPHSRKIFLLRREQQYTNKEIAAQLGISVKAVEKQMTISLRMIRKAMEPHLIELLILAIAIPEIQN
jgi:RNA polymerase sigma-70 factor (family 1)